MRYFVVTLEEKLDLWELARCKANCAIFFSKDEIADFLRRMKATGGDKPPKIYEAELTVSEISIFGSAETMGDKA